MFETVTAGLLLSAGFLSQSLFLILLSLIFSRIFKVKIDTLNWGSLFKKDYFFGKQKVGFGFLPVTSAVAFEGQVRLIEEGEIPGISKARYSERAIVNKPKGIRIMGELLFFFVSSLVLVSALVLGQESPTEIIKDFLLNWDNETARTAMGVFFQDGEPFRIFGFVLLLLGIQGLFLAFLPGTSPFPRILRIFKEDDFKPEKEENNILELLGFFLSFGIWAYCILRCVILFGFMDVLVGALSFLGLFLIWGVVLRIFGAIFGRKVEDTSKQPAS